MTRETTAVTDTRDFAAFCERQYPRLVGALRLHVRDDGVAEELAQEAFARTCRDWTKVSTLMSPASWLFRVGFNLANSHHRRRAAERRARHRLHAGDAGAQRDHAPEDTLMVRAALQRLRPRAREALILRYYVDLSVEDVARLMRCPESTVKTLTRRGLAHLRAQPEFAGAREASDG